VPEATPAGRPAPAALAPRARPVERRFAEALALGAPPRRPAARAGTARPEPAAAHPTGEAPWPPGATTTAAAPVAPELATAVRALPPVIAAVPVRGGAELTLGFGGSLSVVLRAGPEGLELALHPAPGLEQAARAELPGLVEALGARGVRVARAEVRPGYGRRQGRRPR
jgi:hypothetical protein